MLNAQSRSTCRLSRRAFLKNAGLATALLADAELAVRPAGAAEAKPARGNEPESSAALPWYRRTLRWGQTNITEADPLTYDIESWRAYWKRTRTQGVIINAGGIVAYYPSKDPLQYRAKALGDRDLYGELARAAHQDGLAVLARMDSNRAHQEFYRAHPDWFARDRNGNPYRAGDLYVTCINSPYYQEWIPGILQEIIERTHPEGITDNSWSGLGRSSICFCENCSRSFRAQTGKAIPNEKSWTNPIYRAWIQWNYARRLEVWDLNNRVTKAAGGPHCLWIGMNSGSITSQCQSFRDFKGICERAEIIMLDHQSRSDPGGFQQNAESGHLIHGLLGWEKLIPESMAMYQAGRPTFRKSSKPEPEARLWVVEGIAGGIQPWWHHVGAEQEDRRQFRTIEPLNRWHEACQQFLVNRQPLARVGVLWSQQSTDFQGRDHPEEFVEQPFRGFALALLRARIPWLPVQLDYIERDNPPLAVLILPNLGAISDAQLASLRRFVERGGGLVATGEASLFNEWGDRRPDFALADLFGAHLPAGYEWPSEAARLKRATETLHSYLRLAPSLNGQQNPGGTAGDRASASRHPVLRGFEETDILPFGGALEVLQIDPKADVPLTWVPSFPIYPPETSWMRERETSLPGLVVNTLPNHSRIAYLPADIDRRFARDNLPDHGDLLANIVRWAAKDDIPVSVAGPGLVDCHLYRQPGRLILHLVNLTNAGTWRQPVHELIPIGPLTVRVKLPGDLAVHSVRLLVSQEKSSLVQHQGWCLFEVKSILDHEVVVIE